MNESLKLVDYLLNHPDALAAEMENCDCMELDTLKDNLLKMTRGSRPQDVIDAEHHRTLVRVLRGL